MRISWDSHLKMKKVNDSHENLMSFLPNFMRISCFLMRFSSFHELLVWFLISFSWDSREIFSRESWNAFSWESHENVTRFPWAFLGVSSWNMDIDVCTEFSWDSHETISFSWDFHEAEIFSRDSHESAVVSWDSHEILMRSSRDPHDSLTRFPRSRKQITT